MSMRMILGSVTIITLKVLCEMTLVLGSSSWLLQLNRGIEETQTLKTLLGNYANTLVVDLTYDM